MQLGWSLGVKALAEFTPGTHVEVERESWLSRGIPWPPHMHPHTDSTRAYTIISRNLKKILSENLGKAIGKWLIYQHELETHLWGRSSSSCFGYSRKLNAFKEKVCSDHASVLMPYIPLPAFEAMPLATPASSPGASSLILSLGPQLRPRCVHLDVRSVHSVQVRRGLLVEGVQKYWELLFRNQCAENVWSSYPNAVVFNLPNATTL